MPVGQTERLDVAAVLARGRSAMPSVLQRRDVRWAAAIAAGLLALLALWSLTAGGSGLRHVTAPVARGTLTVIVTATGTVQPTNKVDVSSELSGTVRKVYVDYNSPVTAGQTLAELDADKWTATVDSSRARVAAAVAKVADADAAVVEKEKELARKTTLAARQIASTHDLEVAQAAYDRAIASRASARADVGMAEADLRLNTTNLSKARIVSPISGVVLTRKVDPGQTVAASLQAPVLFSIAEDLRQMELQVDVDEADVGQVRIGQTASFTVDAFPDRTFPAQIRDVRFASETIQGVVTYKALLTIDNSELLLRPGMTATADVVVTALTDALLVPNAALRYAPPSDTAPKGQSALRRFLPGPPRFRPASPREQTGPNRTVWVLRNGTPTAVAVVIGPSDGKRTTVVSGDLKAGDAVVVDTVQTSQTGSAR